MRNLIAPVTFLSLLIFLGIQNLPAEKTLFHEELYNALSYDEKDNVQAILKKITNMNQTGIGDWKDKTYFHIAVSNYHATPALLEQMIKRGAAPDLPLPANDSYPGYPPIMMIVEEGKVNLVDVLLKHKVNINYVHPERGGLLHICAGRGGNKTHNKKWNQICFKLLKAGININQRLIKSKGQTPLISSVWANNVEMTRELLRRGADLSGEIGTGPYKGYTAGMLANILNLGEQALLLRKAGDKSLNRPVSVQPMSKLQFCTDDKQCVRVNTQCCGCNSGGGGDISVNSEYSSYYYRHIFKKDCSKVNCLSVYLCKSEPRCSGNRCAYAGRGIRSPELFDPGSVKPTR